MPSTPSKLKSGSRSQAGSLKYEEIRADLQDDIGNSTRCGIDAFLKHFLYTTLRDDDPTKVKLNEIQKSIEELQLKRYGEDLIINEDTANNGATSDNVAADLAGTLNLAASIQERADDKDDDTLLGSEKEKQLVQERDALLDRLLDDARKLVDPVANNKDLIEELKKFGEAFASEETARYGPFVSLCNNALDLLASCNSKHQFREKDGLGIRFYCNDPSNITSSYDGMQDIERKPDVVITSLIASLLAQNSPRFKFQWSDILGCAEFKVLRKGIPEEGKPWREVFDVKASPQVREHTIEGVEPPNATEGSGSKRVRDDVSVAENLLSSKRQRQSNGTATPTDSNPVSSTSIPENNLNLQVNMIEQSTQQATNDGVERDVSIAENSLPLNNQRQSSAATPTSSKPIPSASVPKKDSNMQKNIMEQQTQQAIKGRVQCASYALEMMSYNAGVHHAINLLVLDGHMCIWYHDRQGIIQSDGLSIFGDFSQFLVLLFAFQRFCPEDWGIIRCLNPQFFHGIENKTRVKNEQEPIPEPEVKLNLQQDLSGLWVRENQDKILTTVEVDMKNFLSHKPHCLSGRATSVISAKSSDPHEMMVCKIYHPEVERRHEGETLQAVRKIAEDKDQNMLKHLPSVLFYGDVPGCTTHRIRSMIKRRWKGHRTLRILGLKKLQKITSVDGARFIKAWLETVICHAFLWKNYVEHGDPSLSNIMYDPETKCGVLSDFDLSLLQWEPRVIGTDRTGTVPFMAIELLSKKYWEGKIQRFYHHELESFIWILAYVCLLYDRGIRKKNAAVDPWRTSNYGVCRMEKRDFYGNLDEELANQVQANYKTYWPMARQLLRKLQIYHAENEDQKDISIDNAPRLASDNLWERFNSVLSSTLPPNSIPDQEALLERLKSQKPSFEFPDETTRQTLQVKYSTIAQ